MSLLWRYHKNRKPVVPAEVGEEVRFTQDELEAKLQAEKPAKSKKAKADPAAE